MAVNLKNVHFLLISDEVEMDRGFICGKEEEEILQKRHSQRESGKTSLTIYYSLVKKHLRKL